MLQLQMLFFILFYLFWNFIFIFNELPLNYADFRGHDSAVTMLKPHSVKPNSTPQSIFEAIDAHDLVSLSLLLDAGFSANSMVNDTYPLHYALRKRRTECVPLLLRYGADMSLRSKGSQPLHIAACKGLDNAIRYLLKRGANVNDINTKSGLTPLHYAVMNDRSSSVSLLISNGADPLLTSRGNQTPLEMALSATRNKDMFSAMMSGGLLKRINCDNLLKVALEAKRTSLAYMLTMSNMSSWDPLLQLSWFSSPGQLKLITRRDENVGLSLFKETVAADHPQGSLAILDSL